jgi:hypothetical protein
MKAIDFDLFTLWYLVILCIGMAVFAKTTLTKTFIPMAAIWVAYRFVSIFLASFIGSFGA